MTRIDFHLNVSDPLLYTCRLVRKAYTRGCKVVCYTTHAATLTALDTMLWTFAEDSFLPHVRTGHLGVDHTPIVLTDKEDDVRHYELLVNLDVHNPPFFARFERLIEVVGASEDSKDPARLRYRFYKDRGYPLQTFDSQQR